MIDAKHPYYSATIPSYCQEVFTNPEFVAGHMLVIPPRAISDHEDATGDDLSDETSVLGLIPVPPFPCVVYRDPQSGDYLVARPGPEPFANVSDLHVLRSTP